MLITRSLVLISLAACGTNASRSTAPDSPAGPDLAGHWKSACTPMNAQQAFSLEFHIQAATWDVDYTVFGDTACTTKFLTVHIAGPYEVGAPSATAQGAHDARFGFTTKTITPAIDAAVGFLESPAGCGATGFAVGVAKDISASGCANLGQRPIAACPADFDLVKIDASSITFGARPADNDMCTPDKRPTALSELSSARG